MIPSQSFGEYPVFGDNATKVAPDNAKYSAGFQQSDVLPAEWMNWAWNKNTKGITDLNAGVSSMESELNNVLSEASISPDGSATNQVYKALRKNCGCIMASSRTITGVPSIDSNNIIKIMFTADIAGSDTTTGMTITYNGTGYPVKACKDGGSLVNLTAHTINGSTKYIQANTIIEFVYDGANFVVIGNPVVLSGDGYEVHANGKIGNEEVGTVKAKATNDIPYGWLECNGQSVLRADYPDLFQKFNTQTYDGTHTLLSRYGSADATHFNLPDYREVALVGIGTNGTDTIATHDAFTLGQFKDDSFKSHQHSLQTEYPLGSSAYSGETCWRVTSEGGVASAGRILGTLTNSTGGTVTRTKEKGVIYLIKVL